MAKVNGRAGQANGALTTALTVNGHLFDTSATNVNNAETQRQHKIEIAGVDSGIYCRLIANTLNATISFVSRKNTANGNQAVTIGALATGEFEDTSNSDAFVATDLVNLQWVCGTDAGHAGTLTAKGSMFSATVNTSQIHQNSGPGSVNTVKTFWQYLGARQETTESIVSQFKTKIAGTREKFHINVTTNSKNSGGSISFVSMKDGGNGNLTTSINDNTTGIVEDTSNTDAVTSGSLIDQAFTGTSAGSIQPGGTSTFTTPNNQTLDISGYGSTTYGTSVTAYEPFQGARMATATESDAQIKYGTYGIASLYELSATANSISSDSTFRFRKNAGNGNGLITITANNTGWFEDTSNFDYVSPTDEVNWRIDTGSTGTSTVISHVAVMLDQAPAVLKSFLTLVGVGT